MHTMLRHSLPLLHPPSPTIGWKKAADKGNGMGACQSQGGGEPEGREDLMLEVKELRFVRERRGVMAGRRKRRRKISSATVCSAPPRRFLPILLLNHEIC